MTRHSDDERGHPASHGIEHARAAEAAPRAFDCPLCGQHITDGKPCGCGARVTLKPGFYDLTRLAGKDLPSVEPGRKW